MINAYLNNNIGYNRAVSSYSTEYQTVYNAMTNKPTSAIAEEQNTMVSSLVSAGVWAELDALYIFAVHTNDDSEALINWVNPGINDATIGVSPTFTAYEGFQGNGTTQYINLNFNPTTDGSNFTINDCSFYNYIRNNVKEDTYDFGGYDGSNRAMFRAYGSTDQVFIGINTTTGRTASNTDSRGFFYSERTASNSMEFFRNDSSLGTDSTASSGRPNVDLYACAQNNNGSPGNFSTRQISVIGFGGALTSGQQTTLMNAIETYMDSNGKGVIT